MLFVLGPSVSDASDTALSSLLFTDPVSPSKAGLLGLLFPYRVAYQHITFLKSFSFLISSAIYQVVPNLFPTSEEQWKQSDLATFFALMNTTIRGLDQQSEILSYLRRLVLTFSHFSIRNDTHRTERMPWRCDRGSAAGDKLHERSAVHTSRACGEVAHGGNGEGACRKRAHGWPERTAEESDGTSYSCEDSLGGGSSAAGP